MAKKRTTNYVFIEKVLLILIIILLFSFNNLLYTTNLSTADPLWIFFTRSDSWKPGDPVERRLIRQVSDSGVRIRTVLRYFNAVSGDYDGNQRDLESLDSVREVRPVKGWRRAPEPDRAVIPSAAAAPDEETASSAVQGRRVLKGGALSYGESFRQLDMLNIPALHAMGLSGKGIRIGVLDSGFDLDGTKCLEPLVVTHRRNFVRGGEDVSGDNHGAWVLACLGGAQDSVFYGPAFGASYILAVTEDITRESRVEEDYWIAGVEWCDSLGADIISSSLVYCFGHDDPAEDYTKEDMDGRTSLVAQTAEIAFSRGILVVNAAGNEGANDWGIITTPGDAEHVIAVGAVLFHDQGDPVIAAFSSRGPTADGRIKPDVVALGQDVRVPYKNVIYMMSGTSFSTPFIAGLCALLLEARPEWSCATVMAALKRSARDLGDPGPDNLYGWGLPDAVKALAYTETAVHEEPLEPRRFFSLETPFPNPFNHSVSIPFTVTSHAHLTIEVYNITGSKAAVLYDGAVTPGRGQACWDSKGFSSGVYFIKASSGAESEVRSIALVK